MADGSQSVICLQESENASGYAFVGWTSFGAPRGKAMVVIPDAIALTVRLAKAHSRISAVCVGKLGIVSVYYPHVSKPLEELIDCMNKLRGVMGELKEKGAEHFLIATDLNCPLPADFNDHTGSTIFKIPTWTCLVRVLIMFAVG